MDVCGIPGQVAARCSASNMSRVKAHVLHADDFLGLMFADGVPDRTSSVGRCNS